MTGKESEQNESNERRTKVEIPSRRKRLAQGEEPARRGITISKTETQRKEDGREKSRKKRKRMDSTMKLIYETGQEIEIVEMSHASISELLYFRHNRKQE